VARFIEAVENAEFKADSDEIAMAPMYIGTVPKNRNPLNGIHADHFNGFRFMLVDNHVFLISCPNNPHAVATVEVVGQVWTYARGVVPQMVVGTGGPSSATRLADVSMRRDDDVPPPSLIAGLSTRQQFWWWKWSARRQRRCSALLIRPPLIWPTTPRLRRTSSFTFSSCAPIELWRWWQSMWGAVLFPRVPLLAPLALQRFSNSSRLAQPHLALRHLSTRCTLGSGVLSGILLQTPRSHHRALRVRSTISMVQVVSQPRSRSPARACIVRASNLVLDVSQIASRVSTLLPTESRMPTAAKL
jgi:hypothetical protein